MTQSLDVSYDTRIPNNVDLSNDKRVLKALEKWHPGYIAVSYTHLTLPTTPYV